MNRFVTIAILLIALIIIGSVYIGLTKKTEGTKPFLFSPTIRERLRIFPNWNEYEAGTEGFSAVPSVTTRSTPPPPVPSVTVGGNNSSITPQDIPDGFTAENLSPFFKHIRISAARTDQDGRGEFTLRAERISSDAISLAGWYIRTNRGARTYVPRAVADYHPTALLREGDVALLPGETISVASAASPLGKNIKVNRCMGYIGESYGLSLFPSCPTAFALNEIVTFPGACQSFIRSIGSCHTPTANELNRFSGDQDRECRAFIGSRFSYQSCYTANRTSPTFFTGEWRAWLGTPLPFDSEHDRLLLFDVNNKLVDSYVY